MLVHAKLHMWWCVFEDELPIVSCVLNGSTASKFLLGYLSPSRKICSLQFTAVCTDFLRGMHVSDPIDEGVVNMRQKCASSFRWKDADLYMLACFQVLASCVRCTQPPFPGGEDRLKLMVQALQGLFLLGVRFTREVGDLDYMDRCCWLSLLLSLLPKDDLFVCAETRCDAVKCPPTLNSWFTSRAALDGPGKLPVQSLSPRICRVRQQNGAIANQRVAALAFRIGRSKTQLAPVQFRLPVTL